MVVRANKKLEHRAYRCIKCRRFALVALVDDDSIAPAANSADPPSLSTT
jgi:hypothetical protein